MHANMLERLKKPSVELFYSVQLVSIFPLHLAFDLD